MLSVKTVFFPLDEQLQLKEKNWSEGVVKGAVWLSGVVDSFAEAAEVFERIGQLSMSESTIWKRIEKWGPQFEAREAARQEQANTLPQRGGANSQQPARQPKSVGAKIGAAMDGVKVHIRQEGWKELKIGCLFDIEVRPTFDRDTGEWVPLPHAVNNTYVTHLGGPEILGQLVWAEAKGRDWDDYYDTQVIGDGAPWIWNLARHYFFDARHSVDYYHALEHLYQAAHLLHPTDPDQARRWAKATETTLFQGHSDRLAHQLAQQATGHSQRAQDLLTEAEYFLNNHRRMQYLELREDGYPIGSGMVESGAKQFKARFTGAGMRWSRDGIKRLLPIRADILSRRFDLVWDDVYSSPLN